MMMRYITAAGAAMIAALAFVGTADEASAGCYRCGPVTPGYHVRTVKQVSNRTQYRDVQRTHYVHKTRPIYNITRVRPIVRVHTVTRVHHYNVPVIRNVNVYSTQRLPAQYIHTNSVQNYYHGCGCN